MVALMNPTLESASTHADVARGRNHQRRTRHPRRRHRRERNADLCRDAVRDRAVGVGQFDLDPIGAGRRYRRLGDIANAALAGLAGHELHLGGVSDLDAGDLALGHFDHGEHRIETDELGDFLAGEGERRCAYLGNLGDHAIPGRRDDTAFEFSLGGRERGLRGLVLRFHQIEIEPRDGVGLHELPLGVELGATLIEQRLGLLDLGLARIVREDGDDVALLHMRAAANPQLLEQSVGARERHDLAVGLGAAGQQQLAAVRHHIGVDDRDAESLLDLGLVHLKRGFAFRRFMRNEIAGQNPYGGRGNQPDSGDAARLHDDFPSFTTESDGRPRSR